MDDARAHKCLTEGLDLIDRWGELYYQRWGYGNPLAQKRPELGPEVATQLDEVRKQTRLARDVIEAMGEKEIAANVAASGGPASLLLRIASSGGAGSLAASDGGGRTPSPGRVVPPAKQPPPPPPPKKTR